MPVRIALTAVLLTGCLAVFAQDTPAAAPQRNLVRFFDKCRAGKPVTVAYIGGSVTAGSWRPFTTQWIRQQFPGLEVTEVNAAIGGTGSELGVFRFDKHVLQYDPDLVFIEFAINDRASADAQVLATMEGLVRQAWKRDRKPDIVFVYVTHHDLSCPLNRHQAVADYYGIPAIDCQASIQALCKAGANGAAPLIDWSIIAPDNVHPNDWGHSIYAATIATFLRKQMKLTTNDLVAPPDTLQPAKFSDLYSTARLVPVTATPPAGWEVQKAEGNFRDGSIMATQVGQSAEFKFTGTLVGLYFELRKDAGIISCEIDGKPVREIDTSWGPTYKFNRHTSTILQSDLAPGQHTLKLTVLEKKHELSAGHEFRLGYLMLAG